MTPLQRLRLANNYVYNRQTGLTSTETTLIKHAKDALGKLLGETNTFFNKEWKDYQISMKEIKMDPLRTLKLLV